MILCAAFVALLLGFQEDPKTFIPSRDLDEFDAFLDLMRKKVSPARRAKLEADWAAQKQRIEVERADPVRSFEMHIKYQLGQATVHGGGKGATHQSLTFGAARLPPDLVDRSEDHPTRGRGGGRERV